MSKPDIENVENDSIATILIDLIGELASRCLLPELPAKIMMDRIVEVERRESETNPNT